jgi:serine/threonine protein kinase
MEVRVFVALTPHLQQGLTKNGEDVAVKKLRDDVINLDNKQFENEFNNLTKLNHQNIVRIFGYCYQIDQIPMEYNGTKMLIEKTYRALCLEYLHKGSLQKYLSGMLCVSWKDIIM